MRRIGIIGDVLSLVANNVDGPVRAAPLDLVLPLGVVHDPVECDVGIYIIC